ncbi:ornithine carbamoyltransferase anabolic [Buchnera aphidicola str. Bp (Baizongia pistaciae)]|uniref:Ornithine carbamoyltransferase n=1 Tax=Buchnera aphidicola subsp. Baizongia pistaciae (strain Bp) TaxID=224915 RepID=OTC_BUCBP|nr:ornithine carbamoyltransferase [Buchnera aphidicola]Q89AG1.1 RecName: Full=Ornithine carbamoyltransferase; Short=OTCase [Buchnera aphidicola str. Bp (Baizongia pistaciae)]AAO27054.1 ornithine carbamoyltransferase anabolic [Buchnera aphidicola str. Bp (Baizongia pistaciae)]
MNALYKKNFLKLSDFTSLDIRNIINIACILKYQKKNKNEFPYLKNKNIVLIFEKQSTRTRCAFEIASFDQGAQVTYLGPGSTHLGYKESIQDTARVLSSIYDGIQYRGHNHETIKNLAKYSNVPVWNGLTEKFHPTQILADLLTIYETLPEKSFCNIKCAYVGDARNNISNTLLEASSLLGLNLCLVAPKCFWPNYDFFLKCQLKAKKNHGNIICTEDIQKGVRGADFIYTDVWVSMGEPKKTWHNRIKLLKKYQVNLKMLLLTQNKKIKVLHCLPSFHDKNTIVGEEIINKHNLDNGIEITNQVFNSQSDVIFRQSENRLHTIKALLLSTLLKEFPYI